MKADQNKVTSLLRDTVLLLCKNGFNYKNHVKVQGLLGITLDNDEVVLVHVNETVAKSDTEPEDATEEDGEENTNYEPPAKATPPARRASKRRHSTLARSAAKTNIPPSNKQKSAKQSSDATAVARFKAVQSTSSSIYMPDAKQLAEPSPSNERITLKLEKFDEAQHEADLNLNKSFEDDSQDNDMQYSDSDQVADEYNSNDMKRAANLNSSAENYYKKLDDGSASPTGSGRGRRAKRTGEKLFPCEYVGCGLSFYRSYTLYRHQRIKHGKRFGTTDQDVYICNHPNCGKAFYRGMYLMKHERDVHGYDHVIQDEDNEEDGDGDDQEMQGELLLKEQIIRDPDLKLDMLGGIVQRTVGVNQPMGGVNQHMGGVNQQMGGISQQMGGVNQQMGVIQQMGGINLQMGGLNHQMGGVNQQMLGVNQQMVGVNQQMVGVNQQMVRMGSELS